MVAPPAQAGGLTIDVRDEGPGIPAEERHHVFERFTRGERATGGGTGLGLAIARWVVDLHGGSIAVVDPGSVHPGSVHPSSVYPSSVYSGAQALGCRIRVTIPS